MSFLVESDVEAADLLRRERFCRQLVSLAFPRQAILQTSKEQHLRRRRQRALQPVNQFLDVLAPERFEHTAAMEASLPKTLVSPFHNLCILALRLEIEAGTYGHLAADCSSLPFVLGAHWA